MKNRLLSNLKWVDINNNSGRKLQFDKAAQIEVTLAKQITDPISGEPRPGSSQGFPGYSPANEVNESRTNFSLYADGELDITKALMVNAAVRFENYSDFGSTVIDVVFSQYLEPTKWYANHPSFSGHGVRFILYHKG